MPPDDRRAALSNFFLLAMATISLLLALINLFHFEAMSLAATEAIVFVAVAAALVDQRLNRNVERASWVTVFSSGGLVLYYYWYVEAAFSASVWVVFFAMVNFFLLGTRKAIPVYLAFSSAVVALVLLHRADWPAVQPDAALINILATLVACGAAAYYQERSRERAYERIQDLANKDCLTGVSNRRHFVECFAEARGELESQGRRYALLLADLDDFKRINDSFGHAVGDEVIKTVTSRMAAAVRAGDLVGRLGGEEFGVLLRDCDGPAAQSRAEAIRAAVAGDPVATKAGLIPVTVSLGVAGGDSAAQDFHELFAHADRRLYAAKAQGRNRVVAGCPPASG